MLTAMGSGHVPSALGSGQVPSDKARADAGMPVPTVSERRLVIS